MISIFATNFSDYLCFFFLVDAKQAQGFLSFFKTLPHVSVARFLFSEPIVCCLFWRLTFLRIGVWETLVVCLVSGKMGQKEREMKFGVLFQFIF